MPVLLTHYLDTSALMRFLDTQHPSCAPLTAYLRTHGLLLGDGLWSSKLTYLEATRVAIREQDLQLRSVVDALFTSVIHVADIDDDALERARHIPQHVKSLDAIHLGTVLGAGGQTLLTYDANMARVAHSHRIDVAAP